MLLPRIQTVNSNLLNNMLSIRIIRNNILWSITGCNGINYCRLRIYYSLAKWDKYVFVKIGIDIQVKTFQKFRLVNVVIFCRYQVRSMYAIQWRIQEFPNKGPPTPKCGAKIYYLARFLPKTVWKWKKMDQEGAHVPGALESANVIYYINMILHTVIPVSKPEGRTTSQLTRRIPGVC